MKRIALAVALLVFSPAVSGKPQPQTTRKIPAGAVPIAQATRRIAALQEAIEVRRVEMSRLYNFGGEVRNTLRSAFQRRGVHQSVWDNVPAWADNDVYPV